MDIPSSLYCGFSDRSADRLPLGFLTPDGTDKAAMKRKATVDGWRDTSIEPMTFTNEPQTGFRLVDSIKRHGWNGGNVVVRVEDPRGFELEISVANLLSVMESTTVINGEIQSSCLWAREGGKNILIPTDSEWYKGVLASIEAAKTAKKAKKVKPQIGDVVKLRNGETRTYAGTVLAIRPGKEYQSIDYHCLVESLGTGRYLNLIKTPDVIEILSSTGQTQEEILSSVTSNYLRGILRGNYRNPVFDFYTSRPYEHHRKPSWVHDGSFYRQDGKIFYDPLARSGTSVIREVTFTDKGMILGEEKTFTNQERNALERNRIYVTVTFTHDTGRETYRMGDPTYY